MSDSLSESTPNLLLVQCEDGECHRLVIKLFSNILEKSESNSNKNKNSSENEMSKFNDDCSDVTMRPCDLQSSESQNQVDMSFILKTKYFEAYLQFIFVNSESNASMGSIPIQSDSENSPIQSDSENSAFDGHICVARTWTPLHSLSKCIEAEEKAGIRLWIQLSTEDLPSDSDAFELCLDGGFLYTNIAVSDIDTY